MKKYIILILSLVLFSITSVAQDKTTQESEFIVSKDTTKNPILKELLIIRNLQEEAKEDRKKIKAKMEKQEAEQNEVPTNEYGAILQVEHNTRPHWYSDGWNLFGVLTFFLAIIAFAVSWGSYLYTKWSYKYTKDTYFAQIKTEDNTRKLSQEAQRHLLNELLRHLYRNFVITYTMRTKMKDIKYKGYPSEEHFEKLKIPMENIHLEAFYGEDEKFQLMHVLYLNLRNYNEEVEVALKHIIDPVIKKQTKDEDFDTLEFKVSFLTEKIIDTIYEVWGENAEYKNDMRKAMNLSLSGKTNATKNIDVPNSGKFSALTLDALKNTSYTRLYSESELEKVLETFNHDVHEERKKNERGAWKVRMIKF